MYSGRPGDADMTEIQKVLFSLEDKEYAAFQAKLNPTVLPKTIIGVRVPELRKLASAIRRSEECDAFLDDLPHRYFEENMLHAILLSGIKDYGEALDKLEKFLGYIDNWAVCDTLRPAAFKKHRDELYGRIQLWLASDKPFICRFGIEMLLVYYLDSDFKPEYAQAVADVRRDDYYVKMMTAWYFATALAKQWDAVIPFIEQHKLPEWTHRKAIQKCCESYRISSTQKEYLRSLK